MEFLCQNGHSRANIENYMAAIRTLHILYGLSTHPFRDQRIQLYLKALKISAPLDTTIRPILDIQKLQLLLMYCDTVLHSTIFKALYVTCFFSFLRLSNILPQSVATFDNTRHLAKGSNSLSTSLLHLDFYTPLPLHLGFPGCKTCIGCILNMGVSLYTSIIWKISQKFQKILFISISALNAGLQLCITTFLHLPPYPLVL